MLCKALAATPVFLLLAVSIPMPAYSAAEPSDGGDHPYIYPKNGQTQDQLWSDRYACHSWAKSQSGFDPTKQAIGVAPDENAARRDQYRRAMTACLDARGYSVRFGAPPAAAPPAATLPPSAPPPPAGGTRAQHAAPLVPEHKYHPLSVQIEGGYSVTTGTTSQYLNGGSNVGLGLTWFPLSALPVGLRLDGSYSTFGETSKSLDLASQSLGTPVSFGHAHIYGGDLDAEFDLRMGPRVKEYIFGGAGRYREQTIFKQVSFQDGVGCDFYECFYAYFPFVSAVERSTTGWLNSWNAGIGFEFELADPTRFFIEARYLRIGPSTNHMDFIPIRVGLRF